VRRRRRGRAAALRPGGCRVPSSRPTSPAGAVAALWQDARWRAPRVPSCAMPRGPAARCRRPVRRAMQAWPPCRLRTSAARARTRCAGRPASGATSG